MSKLTVKEKWVYMGLGIGALFVTGWRCFPYITKKKPVTERLLSKHIKYTQRHEPDEQEQEVPITEVKKSVIDKEEAEKIISEAIYSTVNSPAFVMAIGEQIKCAMRSEHIKNTIEKMFKEEFNKITSVDRSEEMDKLLRDSYSKLLRDPNFFEREKQRAVRITTHMLKDSDVKDQCKSLLREGMCDAVLPGFLRCKSRHKK